MLQIFSQFRQKIPQENFQTITYEGFSWEPKSAGNVLFPADFWSKTARKSAGNK
jgi:glucose dehydrogenase